MVKKITILATLGFLLSGCFMAPMAFIGPATSGFSTASIAQSAVTTSASYVYKKTTGKTFIEHAMSSINKRKAESISQSIQQTYLPKNIIFGIKIAP